MKRSLLLAALALCAALYGIDDRFLHQLVHVDHIPAYSVDYSEDQVVLHNQNYLWVYSIFNPWQPKPEAVFVSTAMIGDVNVMGGNNLYISSQEAANTVTPVDTLDTWTRVYFPNLIIGDKITREGSILYVADRFKGIDIMDIGKGGMREILSTFSEKWGIRDFLAEYPYLYALNDFGLVTVDVADQQFPLSLGVNYEISDARVMAKNGSTLWIGAGKDLLAISILDLEHPKLINKFRLSNDILDLEIKDDRLFLALGKGGVKILGIHNPLRIDDLNTIYTTGSSVYDLALDGDLVFMALGKDGWVIYEYR
jgi:hypothetical protein